jgi:hypothetical protein
MSEILWDVGLFLIFGGIGIAFGRAVIRNFDKHWHSDDKKERK